MSKKKHSEEEIDFDSLTITEIKGLIAEKKYAEATLVEYYNNEWWSEVPGSTVTDDEYHCECERCTM